MKKKVAVISGIMGAVFGTGLLFKTERDQGQKIKELETLNRKNDAILRVFAKWMKLKQKGNSISKYLNENGYKSIAIYGMHYLGECLLDELKGSSVEVKYAIDRNAQQITADVDVITLDDNPQKVDAIIVTAFWFFDEIENEILEIIDCPVLSLEDIIFDMEYEA